MKKKCYKCLVEKDLDKFSINRTRKDGRNSQCKSCHKKYRDTHYQQNKEKQRAQVKTRRKEIREWFVDYRSKCSCSICGESRWWVLDFHHTEDKDTELSTAVGNGWSIQRLEEEILKCEVLCANCHRDLHYKQKNATLV